MLPSFKEFTEKMDEMSQAKKGDWKDAIYFMGSQNEFITNKTFNEIDIIKIPKIQKELVLLKDKNKDEYILGFWIEEDKENKLGKYVEKSFKKIFFIQLTYISEVTQLGYNKCYTVSGVGVDTQYQGNQIATFMYKYFINNMHMTLVSDKEQYFGARRLWSKLSKELDIKVDIVDIKSKQIIFKDVILHHGTQDKDFDERMWSYSKEKHYIRCVMTKIL